MKTEVYASWTQKFSRAEVFDLTLNGSNFLITIIVLIAFCMTLSRNISTDVITDVPSNRTNDYTSCSLQKINNNLEGNVIVFRCSRDPSGANRNYLMRANFLVVEANYFNFANYSTITAYCWSHLTDHDGNQTFDISPIVPVPPQNLTINQMLTAVSRAGILFSKYSSLKLVANDPTRWDFKSYLDQNVYGSIKGGASQTSYALLSTFFNTSAELVRTAILASEIVYVCFNREPETDLDFFFRASSYTFFVSIVFMLIQLIAYTIYAWCFDD